MSFEIALRVDPKAAIMAGYAAFGVCRVKVDGEFLAKLSDEEKNELAQVVLHNQTMGEPYFIEDDVEIAEPFPIAIADLDTLACLLRHRVQARREYAETLKASVEKRKREQAAEATAKRQLEANFAAQMQAIHRWVEEHGDEDQKERLKDGTLPEEEILVIVREQLFEPLDMNAEYSRMKQRDVCRCACQSSVVFTREPIDHLRAEQHRRLVNIRSEAPEGARVKPRRHRGACDQCDCPEVVRVTAHVEVDWHTVALGKEYILDD